MKNITTQSDLWLHQFQLRGLRQPVLSRSLVSVPTVPHSLVSEKRFWYAVWSTGLSWNLHKEKILTGIESIHQTFSAIRAKYGHYRRQ